MNWFTWEQHKKQFLIAGIFLALAAAFMIPTGLHFWHAYQHAAATCGQTNTCDQLPADLFQTSVLEPILFQLEPVAFLFLPILFGLFWGVPLLTREYAEGTHLLVWMRSISRRKWLTVKLVWLLVATAVFTGAFAALNTWWSKTPNALNADRFAVSQFGAQGIVPVAYAVFAVALGIAVGAWLRRMMATIGVTLCVLVAVVLVIVPNFVRPHYTTPVTVTAAMGENELDVRLPSGAWVLSKATVDKHGRVFSDFELPNWPPQCQALVRQMQAQTVGSGPKFSQAAVPNCLTAAGYRQIARYQPAYRYWNFQRIEAGLYITLSLIPIGATYWLVLRRDA